MKGRGTHAQSTLDSQPVHDNNDWNYELLTGRSVWLREGLECGRIMNGYGHGQKHGKITLLTQQSHHERFNC
jgi:hypothetical protein